MPRCPHCNGELKFGRNPIPKPDNIDWSLTNVAIGKALGVHNATIRLWRKEAGMPNGKRGRNPMPESVYKVKLEDIDFNLTDMENAKKLGVTRERIRQIRKASGLPSSRELWVGKMPEWAAKVDWSQRNTTITKLVNMTPSAVRQVRYRYNLPAPTAPHPRAKYDWAKVDWSLRTCEIAKQLGIHQASASMARAKYAPHTIRRYQPTTTP